MKFEVGQIYEMQRGDRIEITSIDSNSVFPIKGIYLGTNGKLIRDEWTSKGAYFETDQTSAYDLIRLIEDVSISLKFEVGEKYLMESGGEVEITSLCENIVFGKHPALTRPMVYRNDGVHLGYISNEDANFKSDPVEGRNLVKKVYAVHIEVGKQYKTKDGKRIIITEMADIEPQKTGWFCGLVIGIEGVYLWSEDGMGRGKVGHIDYEEESEFSIIGELDED